MTKRIKIVDYSDFPAGRDKNIDPFSGDRFRDEILLPALEAGKVEVSFSGVFACLPSFLDEAFAGLLRAGLSREHILQNLTFDETSEPTHQEYIELIYQFIDEEAKTQKK